MSEPVKSKRKFRWRNLFEAPEFTNSLREAVLMNRVYAVDGLIWFSMEIFPVSKLPIDCGNPVLFMRRDGNTILSQPTRCWKTRKNALGVQLAMITHWCLLPHPNSYRLPCKKGRMVEKNTYNFGISKDILEYITGNYEIIKPSKPSA